MAHEDLTREQLVESSSDRSFGLVFAAVFVLIGGLPILHGEAPRGWAFLVAGLFAAAALLRPSSLAWLNRLWTRLGVLLGSVVGPVALGVLFYGVLTPLAMAMRLAGKDPLRLKRDAGAASYWIRRDPPGPPPESMTNQF